MEARQELLLELLAGPNQQFEIPLYQRRYSWTDAQRAQLWADVLRVAQAPGGRRHFTGPVVFTQPRSGMGASSLNRSRLIDGQQRMTTTTLLLHALSEHLQAHPATAAALGKEADRLRADFLFNTKFNDDRHFKLRLSRADDATLRAVLKGEDLPEPAAREVLAGVAFFHKKLQEPGLNVAQIWEGLNRLEVVQIMLTEGVDDLGLIFESLNSTGKALAQADLIRNNVLMGLDEQAQNTLSEKHWQPMEELFAETGDGSYDRFMRDFLTLRSRSIPNESEVYEAFKAYRSSLPRQTTVTQLVQDIAQIAQHFMRIIQPFKEANPVVRLALEDLGALRLQVIQPFVLELLEDRQKGLLDHAGLTRALRLLESFLMRRAVVGERTAPLNRFFATLGRDLPKHEDYLRSLERALVRFQDSDRDGFPSDEVFRAALQEVPIYSRPVCKPLLMRLERKLNEKETFGGSLTIEHVMPQNANLSESWRQMLGENWQEVQEKLVHTLGNLTLTGYNSELGDRSLAEKKTLPPKAGDTVESEQPKGYKYSRLLMTRAIADEARYATWDKDVIQQRAAKLALEANSLFPFPAFTSEELKELRAEGRQRSKTPTVEGHLETSSPALRTLFMNFRSRLLALDPQVMEAVKKQYVAYKIAGSNFCDMVPQPSLQTIKCWLNVPFHDLDDPEHLARDVSEKGGAGDGNGELVLGLQTDLDAVLLMAKQALNHQLALKQTSAQAKTSSGSVDFTKLTDSAAQVLEELGSRVIGLGGRSNDTKHCRTFREHRVFMEVQPRRHGVKVAVKLDPAVLEADALTGWGVDGQWLNRTLEDLKSLNDAWPAIEAAYVQQKQGSGNGTSGSVTSAQSKAAKALFEAFLVAGPEIGQDVQADPTQKSLKFTVAGREFARIYSSFYSRGLVAVRLNVLPDTLDNPANLGGTVDSDHGTIGFVQGHFEAVGHSVDDLPLLLGLIRQAYEAHRG
ncbi:DUF262 and DUF1524 domain-containing protein [Deinococcus sp. AJ005]|uniref:DUF262 and DUF1524 domain-containing protein n=1 Tax=Deinococcus sp. AJ005 TaxID=2652443 RepID=UPI00125CD030|nr:DUF262 and DUF1524 domain-containing protein [Deinococcus sp. AJ005]QFP75035.1 DUF262 domain-containing protein [Deinococcus sp. AJ005]